MAFTKLTRLAVKPETTRTFTLDAIVLGGDDPPALTVRHAGDTNPTFKNALAKHSEELNVGARDSRAHEMARAEIWAKLLAGYVVTGWEHVYDDEGALVAFSVDQCEEFLIGL